MQKKKRELRFIRDHEFSFAEIIIFRSMKELQIDSAIIPLSFWQRTQKQLTQKQYCYSIAQKSKTSEFRFILFVEALLFEPTKLSGIFSSS